MGGGRLGEARRAKLGARWHDVSAGERSGGEGRRVGLGMTRVDLGRRVGGAWGRPGAGSACRPGLGCYGLSAQRRAAWSGMTRRVTSRRVAAGSQGRVRHVGMRQGQLDAGMARRGGGVACRDEGWLVGWVNGQAGSVGVGCAARIGLVGTVGIVLVRRKVPACECLDCQPGCVLEWVIEDSRQVQARLRMSSGVGGSEAVRHVGETWHGVRCRQVGRGEPGWVSQEGRAQAWVVASGSFARGRLVGMRPGLVWHVGVGRR